MVRSWAGPASEGIGAAAASGRQQPLARARACIGGGESVDLGGCRFQIAAKRGCIAREIRNSHGVTGNA